MALKVRTDLYCRFMTFDLSVNSGICHEDEAKLASNLFKTPIESPYRWRDSTTKVDVVTEDELDSGFMVDIAFSKTVSENSGEY